MGTRSRWLVAVMVAAVVATPAAAQERWHGDVALSVSRDAMTDEAQYVVMTMSGPEDPRDGEAGFGLHCEGEDRIVVIGISGFTTDDYRRLQVRFGSEEPQMQRFHVQQKGTTVMHLVRDGPTVRMMVAKAKGAPKLAVRDPEDGSTYIFSLRGVRSALAEVPCM